MALLGQTLCYSKTMSTYKYILLDWDGNIAKTLDIWLEACRVPIEKRGKKLSDEEVAASFGAFAEHIKHWGFKDVQEIINEMTTIAKQKLPDVELYPDALAVLESLSNEGKKLALITTSHHEHIKYLLEKYKMGQLFQAIVAHEDTVNHKPHPEPLLKAINILGGSKEQSLMVGDSDKDLGAANNAGIDSVLFYPPEHTKFYELSTLQKLKPTYIINDFRKLLNIV